MAEEFGKPDDTGQKPQDTSFNQSPSDNDGSEGGADISKEELDALRKRDDHAQPHITQLESKNDELRTQVAELENDLASAATIDSVLERIQNKPGEDSKVAPGDVADLVVDRLQEKARKELEDNNWATVVSQVTEHYGEWDKGNEAIQAAAAGHNMTPAEASQLARKSPSAFAELFLQKEQSPGGQQSIASTALRTTNNEPLPGSPGKRDHAYYEARRKSKSPAMRDQYWSTDEQAQLRRDLHGAT